VIHPAMTYAATAVGTACVCIPATVAVAPHVRHAIAAHHRPAVHLVAHHAAPAKPVVQYVFERCAPIALPDADLSTTPADIEGLPLIERPARTGIMAALLGPRLPGPPVFIQPRSSVPEPATWGLMVVGFGMAGGAVRGRTRAQNNRRISLALIRLAILSLKRGAKK
jgi:hypothetical protein